MTDWPNGARAAVSFTFDFDAEEVWIGEDPANADRPGILSQGTYGAKVAVPLVLDVLRRRGVRACFFIPGRVAEVRARPGRIAGRAIVPRHPQYEVLVSGAGLRTFAERTDGALKVLVRPAE